MSTPPVAPEDRAAEAALRRRNLATLATLAVVFVLPLSGAFFAYYVTGWRPPGHLNHGVLLRPVRALPALPADGAHTRVLFRRQWTLVYVGAGACDRDCRDTLFFMRQTRLGLGNDMTRVARVFVATGECCDREFLTREHPGLALLDAGGDGAAAALLPQFPTPAREHTVFVVDPLGNLMMSYDARQDPHGLLEDLKKLLRLSHIG